jgi:Leucine-rich repeat (LRR) protein
MSCGSSINRIATVIGYSKETGFVIAAGDADCYFREHNLAKPYDWEDFGDVHEDATKAWSFYREGELGEEERESLWQAIKDASPKRLSVSADMVVDSDYDIVAELTSLESLTINSANPWGIGDLSDSWIWELEGLAELNIADKMEDMPPEIGGLVNLKRLNLNGCKLFSLPSEIGNLTGLERLDLAGNYIAELPPEMENLVNLTWLDLRGVDRDVPLDFLGQTKALTVLRLSGADVVPDAVFDMTGLQELDLSGNGEIQGLERIGNLTGLRKLELARCGIESLPDGVEELVNLAELDLSGNGLSSLPETMASLTGLVTLNLDNNPIGFPEILTRLPSLTELSLNEAQVTTLPPSSGGLVDLSLSGNKIGGIPETWDWERLRRINLSKNRLKAKSIPLGMTSGVHELDLSQNPFYREDLQSIFAGKKGGSLVAHGLKPRPKEEPVAPKPVYPSPKWWNSAWNNRADEGVIQDDVVLSFIENKTRMTPAERKDFWDAIRARNPTEIHLWNIPLRKIPKEVWGLETLREVTLAGCGLRKVPKELNQLPNLASLDLADNQLTEEAVQDFLDNHQRTDPFEFLVLGGNKSISYTYAEYVEKHHAYEVGFS